MDSLNGDYFPNYSSEFRESFQESIQTIERKTLVIAQVLRELSYCHCTRQEFENAIKEPGNYKKRKILSDLSIKILCQNQYKTAVKVALLVPASRWSIQDENDKINIIGKIFEVWVRKEGEAEPLSIAEKIPSLSHRIYTEISKALIYKREFDKAIKVSEKLINNGCSFSEITKTIVKNLREKKHLERVIGLTQQIPDGQKILEDTQKLTDNKKLIQYVFDENKKAFGTLMCDIIIKLIDIGDLKKALEIVRELIDNKTVFFPNIGPAMQHFVFVLASRGEFEDAWKFVAEYEKKISGLEEKFYESALRIKGVDELVKILPDNRKRILSYLSEYMADENWEMAFKLAENIPDEFDKKKVMCNLGEKLTEEGITERSMALLLSFKSWGYNRIRRLIKRSFNKYGKLHALLEKAFFELTIKDQIVAFELSKDEYRRRNGITGVHRMIDILIEIRRGIAEADLRLYRKYFNDLKLGFNRGKFHLLR